MAQLYEQLRVTKIKTSVYHPEANICLLLTETFLVSLVLILHLSYFIGVLCLAVIKETWLEGFSSEENLITHVLEIRRRLATIQQVVQENLKQAQGKQKRLYDVHS